MVKVSRKLGIDFVLKAKKEFSISQPLIEKKKKTHAHNQFNIYFPRLHFIDERHQSLNC